jgi:hypothetical protein
MLVCEAKYHPGSMRVLAWLFALACSQPTTATPPETFVAFASDFAPYASWQSYYVGDVPEGVDLSGPRTVYINELPPHGATEFPVGTMIVKVVETTPTPQSWPMFGLVKRGGGYDIEGAPNWEWFGLSIDGTGAVAIDWRGTGPPPDGGYGGVAAAVSCVFCHLNASSNDYVQTPQLKLSNF